MIPSLLCVGCWLLLVVIISEHHLTSLCLLSFTRDLRSLVDSEKLVKGGSFKIQNFPFQYKMLEPSRIRLIPKKQTKSTQLRRALDMFYMEGPDRDESVLCDYLIIDFYWFGRSLIFVVYLYKLLYSTHVGLGGVRIFVIQCFMCEKYRIRRHQVSIGFMKHDVFLLCFFKWEEGLYVCLDICS